MLPFLSHLIFALAVLSFVLGGYVLYNSRRSARKDWALFLLLCNAGLWFLGTSLCIADKAEQALLFFSERLSTGVLGFFMSEISLILALPIILFCLNARAVKGRKGKNILALVMLLLGVGVSVFYCLFPHLLSELPGNQKMAGPDSTFFIVSGWYALALLAALLVGLSVAKGLEFKRDKRLIFPMVLFWLLGAGYLLVSRLLLPDEYVVLLGIAVQLFALLLYYRFCVSNDVSTVKISDVAPHIYSTMQTPMLFLSSRSRVMLSNAGAVDLFGLSYKQLLDQDIRELLDFDETMATLPQNPRREDNPPLYFTAVSKSKSIRCDVDVSYNFDKYGELVCTVLFVRDKTQVLDLIAQIELEKLLADQERRNAEQANLAKSIFLANTSHEICTPVQTITGMAEQIMQDEPTPTIFENAQSVKNLGQNLLNVLSDILDFSKIESGQMELASAPYAFGPMLNDLVNVVRFSISTRPVRFVVNIDPMIPESMVGDVQRMRQVISTLLSNAVAHTSRGFISMEMTRLEIDGRLVLSIKVADSGTGIRPEEQEYVFGSFVRMNRRAAAEGAENTNTTEEAGLGLSITRSLCRAMGGDVVFSSVYGEGSVFTATLEQGIPSTGDFPFAHVENAAQIRVVVYEKRAKCADSICFSVRALGATARLTLSYDELREGLRSRPDFAFVPLGVYKNVADFIKEFCPRTTVVLLTDLGEVPEPSMRPLSMPSHSLSIANILGRRDEVNAAFHGYTRFTAAAVDVLLVDDINTNLKLAEGLMNSYKINLATATSGDKAIAILASRRFDLVFMDHMMPGMDGVETTALIRKMNDGTGYYQNLPIIAMSSDASAPMKQMFIDAGLNDVLGKPIEKAPLHAILEQWIPDVKKGEAVKEEPRAEIKFTIEGVDVRSGVENMGGNIDEYISMLGIFCSECRQKLRDSTRAMQKQNYSLYSGHMHALRMSSNSIGCPGLSQQAEELEVSSKLGNVEFVEAHHDFFMSSMREVMRSIRAFLDSVESESAVAVTVDPTALKSRCEQLLAALNSFSMSEAEQMLQTLIAGQWEASVKDVFNAVNEDLLMGEFDAAKEKIESFMAGL